MTMTLDPDTERLAGDIARKTGQPIEEVLKAAVAAHARATGVLAVPVRSSEEKFAAMMAIAQRAAQRPVFDSRRPDEIIGYNDLGLPE